jgi:hypothetical protein
VTPLEILAAAVVGVLSAARITRLVVADTFPPSARLRMAYDKVTGDSEWSTLVHCPWCFGPWASAIVLAWGLLTDFHTPWWVFNGWLGGSYIASWIVFHDEDGD